MKKLTLDELKLSIQQAISTYWLTALIILGAIIVGYLSLIWLPKDNPVEECMEVIIHDETGVTVDLTPENK